MEQIMIMKKILFLNLILLPSILILTHILPEKNAFAKTSASAKKNKNIEKLAIIGTRITPRSIGDSSVPLDILSSEEIIQQGSKDMTAMLQSLVPSFNVNDQPISDEATFVRPANLRGLASDHILLLVNGKRRHRSSVISFLGGGLSNGSQGPDISAIPGIALKQIEVLRDGASAQYGSDAIAGVINFVLKDSNKGGTVESQYGGYYKGDGNAFHYATNVGAALTKDGFINLSIEYQNADATSSSVQRTDTRELISAGNTDIKNPAQIWGNPELKNDWKFFVNSGINLTKRSKVYLFGNYSQRTAEGGFFFRNPQTRKGVYADGSGNLLIGGSSCPTIPASGNILDNPTYQEQVKNNPNCWAFNEKFPGGFTPQFGGTVKDFSITNGIKGRAGNNYSYDLSAYWGRNWVSYYMNNTVNASLGEDSPTSFKPGTYIQDEKALSLDINNSFNIGLAEPLSVTIGAEYRTEFYESIAGDEASYIAGRYANQGFSVGSNGFPGLNPRYAGQSGRNNLALYLDMETQLITDLSFGVAIRQEKFSDFGSSTKGKLSTRYQLTDNLAIRSAISNGFKAPTIGQSTIKKVSTTFIGSELRDRAILPPTDPIAILKGGKALTPEESTNFSIGLVGELGSTFFITLDYFNISVKDRISLTSGITLTDSDIEELAGRGITEARSLTEISFFSNDFSTKTQGVDIVANYDTNLFGNLTQFALAFNWTDTKVVDVRKYQKDGVTTQNISPARIKVLEENLPKFRYSLTSKYFYNKWNLLTRLNYFHSTFEDHLDSDELIISEGGLPVTLESKYTVDFELGYEYQKNIHIALGAKNVLNTFPNKNIHSGAAGAKYPLTSPIGINGGFVYARATYFF